MCDSANPYYAPTAGQNMSFGNGPSTRSDIEDDIGHNVTWRTDDDFDNKDRDRRRGDHSDDRWGDRDRDRDRGRLSSSSRPRASWADKPSSSSSASSMGWQRRSSTDSYRRNLSGELSRTDSRSSLSSSYRIPRTSRPVSWDAKGTSTRRDSMHDKYRGSSSSSSSRSRSRGGGGGMSATWAGGRGR
jgi:hypothetical protein